MLLDFKRRSNRLSDTRCHRKDVLLGQDPFKNNCEFVPTHPGHGIDFPHTDLKPFSNGFKQFVTHVMAERIIHRFESIEIKQHEANRLLQALGSSHSLH